MPSWSLPQAVRTMKQMVNGTQTDLLIRLAYSYEEFPAFSSYTRELDEADIFTQEVRLVSKGESALSWIVGGYYYSVDSEGSSKEIYPRF